MVLNNCHEMYSWNRPDPLYYIYVKNLKAKLSLGKSVFFISKVPTVSGNPFNVFISLVKARTRI